MQKIPVRKIVANACQPDQGKFSIRQLQQVLNGEDLVHELHRHDFYFILALKTGKGAHEIDFQSYPIADNTIFVIRPGQVHRLKLSSISQGYLLAFHPTFYLANTPPLNKRWKKAALQNYCKPPSETFTKMYALLANIYNEHEAKKEGFTDAIIAYLDLFFIEHDRQTHLPIKPTEPHWLHTGKV